MMIQINAKWVYTKRMKEQKSDKLLHPKRENGENYRKRAMR
jgi:hypothetical protein